MGPRPRPKARRGAPSMSKARTAIYPGTFDPITNGHMDIIRRASRLADSLIIEVARNAGKRPLFSIDERVELVRAEVAALNAGGRTVEVQAFDNLLMHLDRKNKRLNPSH